MYIYFKYLNIHIQNSSYSDLFSLLHSDLYSLQSSLADIYLDNTATDEWRFRDGRPHMVHAVNGALGRYPISVDPSKSLLQSDGHNRLTA